MSDLTYYIAATRPDWAPDALKRQEAWMLRLGTLLRAVCKPRRFEATPSLGSLIDS